MFLAFIKSAAVVLGACACGLGLFEYLDSRGRKENRSTIRRRLRGEFNGDGSESGGRSGAGSSTRNSTQNGAGSSTRNGLRNGLQNGALNGSHAENESKAGFSALLASIPFLAQHFEREMHRKQQSQYRAELPKMFDVIALGMRVGLGFDQAFALYVRGFKTPLADQCRPRFEVWERGLISRETGLRELAAQIQLKEFDRFVTLILRALDYGAPLTNMLGDLAREARSAYRSERQEMVAKAPVKMLIPTGVLILPAMMMLVIGPIVLDITERMV